MKNFKSDLSLLLLAVIWGSTFPAIKGALAHVSPMRFVAIRFSIGILALGAMRFHDLRGISKREIFSGGVIGLSLGIGYILQTIGLQWTTSGKAGFITGLYVAMVPLLSALFLRQPVALGEILGVLVSTVGLGLLSLDSRLEFGRGDLWMLGCAVFFAIQVVLISDCSNRVNPLRVASVQIAAVAGVAWLGVLLLEQPSDPSWLWQIPASVWGSLLYTGLVATAFCFVLQMRTQGDSSATRAALILGLEAVFAAFFGRIFGNESMTFKEILGCLTIFLGLISAEAARFHRFTSKNAAPS